MKSRVLSMALVVMGGIACRTAPEPVPASLDEVARVRVRVPDGMSRGNVIAIAYTSDEISRGVHKDPRALMEMFKRAQVIRDVMAHHGELALDVRIMPRPSHVALVFDTANQGLEAMMGPRSGLALGMLDVPAHGEPAPVVLDGKPFVDPPEACTGEREELLRLDAPETRRVGDDGQRLLCVRVPPSYAGSGARRYPVVLVFPGFSGWHARSDGWGVRGMVEQEGARTGVEVILVGVGTRTAEGTSYLETSERFGDWDRYLRDRVLREVDTRYRTLPVRAAMGHSTGGWNALATATRHPELVQVVGASSPDAPDLDAWLLDAEGALRPQWWWWMRLEHALGGRGQFTSYAAAWSPDANDPMGYAFPADMATGALKQDVLARWRARSPAADLRTDDGVRRARLLSGNIFITTGRADEFGLFEPSARYAEALKAAGVEARWVPTDLGHFGADEQRWRTLVGFILERLGAVSATRR